MKTLVLITGTEHTRIVLHNQLKEYLGDISYIKSYAVDENIENEEIWGDIFLFSSHVLQNEVHINISKDTPVVIGRRTINYSNIDKLLFLPKGTEVLFVNDIKETTHSCIDILMSLEISHIKYIPYYPGVKDYKKCAIAVTPGEVDKVPKGINSIIDLGPRLLDMSTIMEVMYKVGFQDEIIADMSVKYIKKIIELSQKLAAKTQEMLEFEDKLRNEILGKRYYAKYSFNDIIGASEIMNETKYIAKRLAVTDLSILIQGESGTGKEIFASAIHNHSNRKKSSFLAVNFSAIPESLVESELFGYESGSFTGARKEGKMGIFEQANGGTIFLDEIGDAPLAVQGRLLRVLQERELMRVGGDRVIPLNIRIIAATNRDLIQFIDKGKFREDLYYRLNMAGIMLPSLRERKEDILPIALEVMRKKGKNITLSKEYIDALVNNDWKGNIRELINVLEYSLAMCDGDVLMVAHIPVGLRGLKAAKENINTGISELEFVILKEIYEAEENKRVIGRESLIEILKNREIRISEYNLRKKLKSLEEMNFITIGKGKVGTKITSQGKAYME